MFGLWGDNANEAVRLLLCTALFWVTKVVLREYYTQFAGAIIRHLSWRAFSRFSYGE